MFADFVCEGVESFSIKLVFVPVVLCEEPVECAFAFGRKNVLRDTLYGLVADSNNTYDVGLGVWYFCLFENTPIDRLAQYSTRTT